MSEVIRVQGLRKSFRLPVRYEGRSWGGRLRHFAANPSKEFMAVKDLSFGVEAGDVVGFLGANGSGKSTTIKVLTGILTPSAGEVEVLGYVPHRQRRAYTQHIGAVFGQKSLLWWNIPVIESFKLYRDIYGQPPREFEARLKHLAGLLEMGEFLHVPARKLSLGLRMRAEIVASLLHRPRIVFLDEPTIGLDVLGRRSLKAFLRRLNEEDGTTIFLTTHNMFDVEDLCRRCLVLERGSLIYSGEVAALKADEQVKQIELALLSIDDEPRFSRALARCTVQRRSELDYRLELPSSEAVAVIDEILKSCRLSNLNVLPPSLESIITRLLENGRTQEKSDAAALREAVA